MQSQTSQNRGIVYLLHFAAPVGGRARHYIGFTGNLKQRLKSHRSGHGAAITAACNKAGISYTLAMVWPDQTREFERRLKDRKKSRLFCPVCKAEVSLFDKKTLQAMELPRYRIVVRGTGTDDIIYTEMGYRSYVDAVCVGREIVRSVWKGQRLTIERY
jgi:predicted GIY-YIG superfamily endonuclease